MMRPSAFKILALLGALTLGAGAAGAADQTIRLVFNPGLLPLYAKAKPELFGDVLAKQGIKVEWVDVQGSHAPAIAAVLGGSADVTFGGTTSVTLTSAANGQDVAIAALGRTIPTDGGIVVYPNSGINSVEDLKGKTVAVNRGGFGELTLVAALQKHHIPRDQVNFVFLSLDDGAVAFAAHKVDAYVALSSGVQTQTVVYGAKEIFDVDKDLTEDESITAGNTLSFVTTKKYGEAHKDVLTKVFTAYKAVADWTNNHPDEAWTILDQANKFPQAIKAAVKAVGTKYEVDFPITQTDLLGLQRQADFLLDNKVLPKPIKAADYVVKY